jgi:hypothetical protein
MYAPNPYAFQYDQNGKVQSPNSMYHLVTGNQPYSMYDLDQEQALELCNRYAKLAKKIKRSIRGKIQKVPYSIDTLKLLLKGLMDASSEIEEGVVDSIKVLTGWDYSQIQQGLNNLHNEYFIERRMAVAPRQIIQRW